MAKMPVEIENRFKIPVLNGYETVSENVSSSSTIAATSAAPGYCSVVRVVPLNEAVYVKVGYMTGVDGDVPPVVDYVDNIGMACPAGQAAYFGIDPGMVCSFITVNNANSGTVNVTFI